MASAPGSMGNASVSVTLDFSKIKGAVEALQKQLMSSMGQFNYKMSHMALNPYFAFYATRRMIGGVVDGFKELIEVNRAFELGLIKINTLLSGPTNRALLQYQDRIFAMGKQYGVAHKDIAAMQYEFLSAGVSPKNSKQYEEGTIKLSKILQIPTKSSQEAILGLMQGFGKGPKDISDSIDKIFYTIDKGNMNAEEFAKILGRASASARLARIEMEDMLAMFIVMTRNRISPAEAGTAFINMSTAFLKPTKAQLDAVQRINKQTGGNIELNTGWIQAYGLGGLQQQLKNANPEDIAQVFGSIRGIRGGASLLQNAAGFIEAREGLKTNSRGRSTVAFDKTTDSIEDNVIRLSNAFDTLKLSLVESRSLVNVLKALTSFLTWSSNLDITPNFDTRENKNSWFLDTNVDDIIEREENYKRYWGKPGEYENWQRTKALAAGWKPRAQEEYVGDMLPGLGILEPANFIQDQMDNPSVAYSYSGMQKLKQKMYAAKSFAKNIGSALWNPNLGYRSDIEYTRRALGFESAELQAKLGAIGGTPQQKLEAEKQLLRLSVQAERDKAEIASKHDLGKLDLTDPNAFKQAKEIHEREVLIKKSLQEQLDLRVQILDKEYQQQVKGGTLLGDNLGTMAPNSILDLTKIAMGTNEQIQEQQLKTQQAMLGELKRRNSLRIVA